MSQPPFKCPKCGSRETPRWEFNLTSWKCSCRNEACDWFRFFKSKDSRKVPRERTA